jgi:hypothetical protein
MPFSTRQLVLNSGPQTNFYNATVVPLGMHIIDDEHLKQLCDHDLEALEKEFAQPSNVNDWIRVAVTPTADQISWHMVREDYMGRALFGREKCNIRGAISESRRAWLIWHFDFVEKKSKVQRIVLLDKDEQERNVKELAALLRFTQCQAKARDINIVTIWNPSQEVERAADLIAKEYGDMKATVEDRDSSIPSLRRRRDQPSDTIAWEHNEYYAWC